MHFIAFARHLSAKIDTNRSRFISLAGGMGLFLVYSAADASQEAILLRMEASSSVKSVDTKLAADASILPPEAFKGTFEENHPDAAVIRRFLAAYTAAEPMEPTGLNKTEYLRLIDGAVRGLMQWQHLDGDFKGDIVDPWYEGDRIFGDTGRPGERRYRHYATPHYAHAVSVLIRSGYTTDRAILESGAMAMDAALSRMVRGRERGTATAWITGDFYPYAVMHAYRNYEGMVDADRYQSWGESLRAIDPGRNYSSPTHKSNWNVVSHVGEFRRAQAGFTSMERTERMLADKRQYLTERGTWNFESFAYDNFPRYHLTGLLFDGYRGPHFEFYRERLYRGSWVSLLTQSPLGMHPIGFRSAQHIWNEAQLAALFEMYAAAHAKAGLNGMATVYKRAARLALATLDRRVREDGTFNIVDNRFPPEERRGYEGYSLHTTYNALALHMLAKAWETADDTIPEGIAPADVGGYVYILDEHYADKLPAPTHNYHAVFANVGGSLVQYSLDPSRIFEPIGVQRIHMRGGSPIIGPTDGLATKFGDKQTVLAVGSGWIDGEGQETRLAGLGLRPEIEVLEETSERVRFQADYRIAGSGVVHSEAGNLAFRAEGVVPNSDGGLEFDGGSAHLLSGEARSFLSGDWSIAFDFKWTRAQGRQTLLSLIGEERDSHALLLELDEARGVRALYRSPPGAEGGSVIYSEHPVESDRWQRLLLRRSGQSMELFLDGRLLGETAVGDPVESDFYLLVGRLYRHSNQRAFHGALRDLQVFDQAVEPGRSSQTVAPLQVSMSAIEGGENLQLRETVQVERGKVTISQEVRSGSVDTLAVNYPFVTFDGKAHTEVHLSGNEATLLLEGQGSTVRMAYPDVAFEHLPLGLKQENGDMDLLRAKVKGNRAVFTVVPSTASE